MAANRPADVIRELRLIPPGTRPIHGGPALMGAAFARLGMRDSAMAMLAQARADTTRPYELALLYAALGDPDDAFAALDRAVSERDPLVVSMRNEPRLDALRSDPRFDRVADRIGLPR